MILILADDLTGAADSGAQFARRGFATLLSLKPGSQSGADVLVQAMETRSLAEGAAAARAVRRALELLDQQTPLASLELAYKKIDSTLRGHPAAELSALLAALGESRALVAPAFPAQGRTMLNGVMFVAGQPLERTAFASQASSSNLLEVFAALRPALLPLAGVRAGESAVRAAIRSTAGPLVADAESDSDLEVLARAALAEGFRVFCGSAGLAAALAAIHPSPSQSSCPSEPLVEVSPRSSLRLERWGKTAVSPSLSGKGSGGFGPPRLIAVAGSLHPATQAQVSFACRQGVPVVYPPPEFFAAPGEAGLAAAAKALLSALGSSSAVILAAAPGGALAPAEVARKLAQVAALTWAQLRPTGIFLTGGETARAVCDTLSCAHLWLGGEVEVGIPWSRAAGGRFPGALVVTKAGGFGGEESLDHALKFMSA